MALRRVARELEGATGLTWQTLTWQTADHLQHGSQEGSEGRRCQLGWPDRQDHLQHGSQEGSEGRRCQLQKRWPDRQDHVQHGSQEGSEGTRCRLGWHDRQVPSEGAKVVGPAPDGLHKWCLWTALGYTVCWMQSLKFATDNQLDSTSRPTMTQLDLITILNSAKRLPSVKVDSGVRATYSWCSSFWRCCSG